MSDGAKGFVAVVFLACMVGSLIVFFTALRDHPLASALVVATWTVCIVFDPSLRTEKKP